MNKEQVWLKEAKAKLALVKAPSDFDQRLQTRLHSVPIRKSKVQPLKYTSIAIMAVVFLLVAGYNFPVLAFYGKSLFEFDSITSESIQKLNEQGEGQEVGKQVNLADGTILSIHGVMSDANQFVVFYSLENSKGVKENLDYFHPKYVSGFLTNSTVSSGVAEWKEEGNRLIGTYTFDGVNPFAKKLTIHYSSESDKGTESKSVTFPYKMQEAMKEQVNIRIDQEVEVDKGSLTFSSMKATPMQTIIKGSLNVENGDRVDSLFSDTILIANGEEVMMTGSSVSSGLLGDQFELRFDALPENLNSLELVIQKFVGYHSINESFPLSNQTTIELGKRKTLGITSIQDDNEVVEVRVETEPNVMLDGVFVLDEDGKQAEIQTTVGHELSQSENGEPIQSRTWLFPSLDTISSIYIEGMHFLEEVQEKIIIVDES
ncbi:hypothetical protein Q73_11120 [Bacillus coahuilensis m2-6]|uniref:DUF4179 domain-containing protein n=1 Tax=Bacillus coahuilensis TaxID=408580 RepID=UPI000750552E|nr:DUF4179 domain-containing protein [Bacillus coahuilensis]KUP06693.1 hypothetical protein Q73_11120 [Bacillus coahuilensis m2-6]